MFALFETPDLPAAACTREGEPEWWTGDDPIYAAQAKIICYGCPEILPCWEWGVVHREAGIWGGRSPAERAADRRSRSHFGHAAPTRVSAQAKFTA